MPTPVRTVNINSSIPCHYLYISCQHFQPSRFFDLFKTSRAFLCWISLHLSLEFWIHLFSNDLIIFFICQIFRPLVPLVNFRSVRISQSRIQRMFCKVFTTVLITRVQEVEKSICINPPL